ncbi:hypothetical protein VNO80_03963 [Phaseolus coccineus]|uniref:Uncharacterized protein n=1 Tax=Phaseolus coccineus TaxID=3886 RepID=A0AAN9NSZ3_PHACN
MEGASEDDGDVEHLEFNDSEEDGNKDEDDGFGTEDGPRRNVGDVIKKWAKLIRRVNKRANQSKAIDSDEGNSHSQNRKTTQPRQSAPLQSTKSQASKTAPRAPSNATVRLRVHLAIAKRKPHCTSLSLPPILRNSFLI